MRPMLNLQSGKIRGMKWLCFGLLFAAVATAIWDLPYFTLIFAWCSGAAGTIYIIFRRVMNILQMPVPEKKEGEGDDEKTEVPKV